MIDTQRTEGPPAFCRQRTVMASLAPYRLVQSLQPLVSKKLVRLPDRDDDLAGGVAIGDDVGEPVAAAEARPVAVAVLRAR